MGRPEKLIILQKPRRACASKQAAGQSNSGGSSGSGNSGGGRLMANRWLNH